MASAHGLNAYFLTAVKYLNRIAMFVAVWAFLAPFPYPIVIVLCALLFFAALFAFVYSKGMIPLEVPKKTRVVHVAYAIGGPSIVLAWRGFCDFHFVQAGALWLPLGIAFFCLSALLYLKVRSFNLKTRAYLVALPYLFAFSFGAVVEANGLLPSDDPVEYRAHVISKQTSRGGDGPTLYYLMVTEWLDREYNNKLVVSKRVYDSFNLNDDVRIMVMQGALNIPYYRVILKH